MKKITYVMMVLLFIIMAAATLVQLAAIGYICFHKGPEVQEVLSDTGKITTEEMSTEKAADTSSQIQADVSKEKQAQESLEKLTDNCETIDEEFATWLLEHYEEAFTEAVQAIDNDDYTDTLWYTMTGKSLFVLRDEYKGILDSEEAMREHLIYQKDCSSTEFVSLSFAGDVSFADDYAPSQNYTREGISGAFSADLQKTMQEADIFMLNNEFCYSTRGTPLPKGYNFRADPSRVKRLDEMGVDIVSIANNHAYDYGAEGFLDTIATLNEDNMPYVGGGTNLEDAKTHIVYFIANGIKIGYIAASQVERDEPIYTQPATENSPGVVRCYEPELVNEMIAEAKKNCDFVIVYPHWGTELVKEIQSDQQQLAYSFIDAGADAVIGGHPHCLQGVEYYNGTPIFYSLSNFSFSSKVVDSTVLNLEITIDGIRQARYIPCMEQNGRTHQCDEGDDNYNRILELLNSISANAQIDEKGIVSEKE